MLGSQIEVQRKGLLDYTFAVANGQHIQKTAMPMFTWEVDSQA